MDRYSFSVDQQQNRSMDRHRREHRKPYRHDHEYQDRKSHADLIERLIIGKINNLSLFLSLFLSDSRTLKTRSLPINLILCSKKKKKEERVKEGRTDRIILL